MFGWNSISADLLPAGAPGTSNPFAADFYEMPSIIKRTIPLWVAYLLMAKQSYEQTSNNLLKQKEIYEILIKAASFLDDQDKTVLEKKLNLPRQALHQGSLNQKGKTIVQIINQFIEILTSIAEEKNELPKYKIHSNIAIVGHSLGGALSQTFLVHITHQYGRVPLPGHNFICYGSNSPAVTKSNHSHFWEFILTHRKLLISLKQSWEITLQFEQGDVVAQSISKPRGHSLRDKNGHAHISYEHMTAKTSHLPDHSLKNF